MEHNFVSVLRDGIVRLGMFGTLFSGHSYRQGGATSAFLASAGGVDSVARGLGFARLFKIHKHGSAIKIDSWC